MEEKLLWRAYRNSPTLCRTVPSPIPYGLPGKATDFKVGGYIYRANPNKSPLKILQKMECGRIQGLPKFFGNPVLSQERVKLRTSNFVRNIHRVDRNKSL